jgi:peptide/nickel transport system substrate-binding protein
MIRRILNGEMTRREMLRNVGAMGLVSAASSALLLPPMAWSQQEPRRGGTLAIGTDVFPLDFVPSSSTALATTSLMCHVYEGLVAPDPATGTGIKPGLAESWQISPDGKVYTFKLRRGVKFHDGTDFTAEAVTLNFERLRNPDSRHYYKIGGAISGQVFNDTERAEIVDPYTVRYYLKQRNGDFIYLLKRAYAYLISPAVIKKYTPEQVAKHATGTGPFRLTVREEGSRAVFERFDGYWGGAPYLDKLVYRPFGEPAAREAALISGEVDLISPPQRDTIDRLKGRFVPFNWGLGYAWLIAFNVRHPFTKDLRVRQALNYAVNRETLVKDLFKGLATVAKGPYAPTNPAWNPSLKGYSYDPERAKKLLAEAGFGGGVKVRALMPTTGLLLLPEMPQSIQADLKKVGVELTYDTMEWTAYLAKVRPGLTDDYIFYATGWGDDYMFWLEQMLGKEFWPPKGANRGWYTNPEVEKLFAAGREEPDEGKRKQLYQRAEEIITREAAWLFTLYFTQLGLRSPKVEGIRLGQLALDFSKAWLRP